MRAPCAGKWLFAVVAICVAVPSLAAEPPVDYATHIKPLFERHCIGCHGSLRKRAGLRLDASQFWRAGGDSGDVVVAGEPEFSLLVAALKGQDGIARMPQDAPPLSDDEIALVERWIAKGAVAPKEELIEGDPAAHWAFRPVVRPALPRFRGAAANPIDAFVAAKRDDTGLAAVGRAPRHVLLRRLYLDLVGVPPTTEELRAFLADDRPDAYERVVDRMLADPRYGERWGRHWMDVWRYSDWYGYKAELRNSQKHIWHWRDWIVESLNANKPYDRMIVEMLAGDEVAPQDDETLRATGFLARNYYKFNRDVWLDRIVEHTGKAFLGLTFNCARCHDHLFDPITQREYYALRAFLEPHRVRIEPIGGVLDENQGGMPRVYDADAEVPTYLYIRGNDKQPDKDNPIAATLPAFFVKKFHTPEPVTLPPIAHYPGLRPEVRATLLRQAQAEVAAAEAEIAKIAAQVSVEEMNEVTAHGVAEARLTAAQRKLEALNARIAADDAKYGRGSATDNRPALAQAASKAERAAALAAAEADELAAKLALAEAGAKPEAERAKAVAAAEQSLADASKRLAEARTKFEQTGEDYAPLTPVYPSTSTGRRTALASWIVDRSNPLTPRVAVNHVWMRHFGKPLVESVFDFGMHGKPPSHPELINWLAAEFVESGWNMKHLHRLIVTSATYRLDSAVDQYHRSLAADPDNQLLWRMNARRAEGEVIRDSLLALAGRLDLTLGGPELDQTADQTTFRRSLYYRHAPEKYAQFLQLFDGASADECYRRAETVVPQQALAQMNSRLAREQSRRIAADLLTATQSRDRQGAVSPESSIEPSLLVERAFEHVLCRAPLSEEREACLAFLTDQESRLSESSSLETIASGAEINVAAPESPRERAFASLVHVLINHHEFVTIR